MQGEADKLLAHGPGGALGRGRDLRPSQHWTACALLSTTFAVSQKIAAICYFFFFCTNLCPAFAPHQALS